MLNLSSLSLPAVSFVPDLSGLNGVCPAPRPPGPLEPQNQPYSKGFADVSGYVKVEPP